MITFLTAYLQQLTNIERALFLLVLIIVATAVIIVQALTSRAGHIEHQPTPDDEFSDLLAIIKTDREKNSLIYFVGSVETKCIKIGHSSNVDARIASLRTANPYPLLIVAAIRGGWRAESAVHARFRRLKMSGGQEWFRLTPELMRFIVAAVAQHIETREEVYRLDDL